MSAHIVVAGAGAVGSVTAYRLARAGHRVTVVDPAAPGANASGVAAGMLAPAFECVLDDGAADRFGLFAAARDLWPPLAAEIGVALDRRGALSVGTHREALGWAASLRSAGARSQVLAPDELDPRWGLTPDGWAAFSPEDWRLEPRGALARLRLAAEHHGARFVAGRVRGFAGGKVEAEGLGVLAAETLVIATGASRDLTALAPDLAGLTPIKGHILRAAGEFAARPVLRAAGAYLCLSPGEAVLGATMEPGMDDAAVDPAKARELLSLGEPLIASLGLLAWRAAAGVRMATADRLPLAGLARGADVILSVGARRNGWLLAPLIAEAVLAAFEGRAAGALAARFDPARF